MTGGVIRLLTWRGQEVALLAPDTSLATGLAQAVVTAWIKGVDQGVIVLPGGWAIEDDRHEP